MTLHQKEIRTELKALYQKWPDIKRYLKTLGCTSANAEDIFQESLIIFCRRKEEKDFTLTTSSFHYIKSTCKLLWYNEARKHQKFPQSELSQEIQEQEDEWFWKEQKIRSIETAIEQLGKQCRELLQLFYGMGWNMTDIAGKLGFRNDKVAKTQKYRCLQKAKDGVLDVQASESPVINSENPFL